MRTRKIYTVIIHRSIVRETERRGIQLPTVGRAGAVINQTARCEGAQRNLDGAAVKSRRWRNGDRDRFGGARRRVAENRNAVGDLVRESEIGARWRRAGRVRGNISETGAGAGVGFIHDGKS